MDGVVGKRKDVDDKHQAPVAYQEHSRDLELVASENRACASRLARRGWFRVSVRSRDRRPTKSRGVILQRTSVLWSRIGFSFAGHRLARERLCLLGCIAVSTGPIHVRLLW